MTMISLKLHCIVHFMCASEGIFHWTVFVRNLNESLQHTLEVKFFFPGSIVFLFSLLWKIVLQFWVYNISDCKAVCTHFFSNNNWLDQNYFLLLQNVFPCAENSGSASGEHGAATGDWTTVALDTVLSVSQQTPEVDNSQHTLTSNDVNHDAVEGREDDSVHTDQWDSPGPDDDDDVSGDERREERVGGTEPLPPLTAEPWSTACSVSPESGKGEDNVRGSLVVLQVRVNIYCLYFGPKFYFW